MWESLYYVDTWIFDLDSTLYAPVAVLFTLINVKIGALIQYIACYPPTAHEMYKHYFR